jgi:hypothetical protein
MSDMTVERVIDIDAFFPMESFIFPFFVGHSDIFTKGRTPPNVVIEFITLIYKELCTTK